ncbi:MAG: acyloxyacyl hydrolase [Proteobacteria bacterium]|nr:acyloxyacyl hydrolase [Pseudomonadota bacterium]
MMMHPLSCVWNRNPLAQSEGATCVLILVFLVFSVFFQGESGEAAILDTSKDRWEGLAGYGQSFPGWGETTQRVETLDLVPRYNHLIFDDLGSGWYRGFHSILIELPLHVVVSPDVSTMIGLNFLASYTFTAGEHWRPYLFGGGGPLYSFADISGMGADWNGNYQFGLGIESDVLETHRLLFEFRYHHISNGGSKEPNEPLNSCKFLIGITF